MGHVFCHHRESGRAELLPRLLKPSNKVAVEGLLGGWTGWSINY